ncbi:hypothetical protein H9P43_003942 [Blastocladiella emersonii ATCC 22665]|nr:hypothetical protein H9P43_003942 [Blastocladiella emersonii ATCC 22665]
MPRRTPIETGLPPEGAQCLSRIRDALQSLREAYPALNFGVTPDGRLLVETRADCLRLTACPAPGCRQRIKGDRSNDVARHFQTQHAPDSLPFVCPAPCTMRTNRRDRFVKHLKAKPACARRVLSHRDDPDIGIMMAMAMQSAAAGATIDAPDHWTALLAAEHDLELADIPTAPPPAPEIEFLVASSSTSIPPLPAPMYDAYPNASHVSGQQYPAPMPVPQFWHPATGPGSFPDDAHAGAYSVDPIAALVPHGAPLLDVHHGAYPTASVYGNAVGASTASDALMSDAGQLPQPQPVAKPRPVVPAAAATDPSVSSRSASLDVGFLAFAPNDGFAKGAGGADGHQPYSASSTGSSLAGGLDALHLPRQ